MVLSLTAGTSSCSYEWWFSSELHHQAFSIIIWAARLAPQRIHEICKIYGKWKDQQPSSQKFRNEDQEMVAILVEACGVKWNELWILQNWAWNVRVSKVKLSCSYVESLLLDSRVGVSWMSMAQEFLFSRDASIDSSPLLRVPSSIHTKDHPA